MTGLTLLRRVSRGTWSVHVVWCIGDTPYFLEADNVQRPGLGSFVRAGRGAWPGERIVVSCRYGWETVKGSEKIKLLTFFDPVGKDYHDPVITVFPHPGDLTEWFKIVRACRRSGEAMPVVDWMIEFGPEPYSTVLSGGTL